MEHLGIEAELVPRVASGFGGGVGRTGLVCGAISGAVIAAGVRYGTGAADHDKERAYEISEALVRSFSARFGATSCRELIGLDLSDPLDSRKARDSGVFVERCTQFVEFCATEIVSKLES